MKAIKTLIAGAALSVCLLPVTSALAKPPPPPVVIVSKVFNNTTMNFAAFTPTETIGTILAKNLFEIPGKSTKSAPNLCLKAWSCTYDFTFSLTGLAPGDTTTLQLAAQAKSGTFATAEPISFDVFSGAPGTTLPTPTSSPTWIGASDNTAATAPVFTFNLANGTYYIQITPAQVAVSGEEASGSLQETLVPEPTSWILMILGFGGVGVALRRRAAKPAAVAVA
jgi:hypothetical protein